MEGYNETRRLLNSSVLDLLPTFDVLDPDDKATDLEYDMFITKIEDREVEFRIDFDQP